MPSTKVQPLQEVTDQLFNVGLILDREHSEAATAVWAIRDAARTAAMRERDDIEVRRKVDARIIEVHQYVNQMRAERVGWGPEAMREADQTATSFLSALSIMLQADRLWLDGPTGLSFGGVFGGISFGLIARQEPTLLEHCTTPPLRWTFHS